MHFKVVVLKVKSQNAWEMLAEADNVDQSTSGILKSPKINNWSWFSEGIYVSKPAHCQTNLKNLGDISNTKINFSLMNNLHSYYL